MWNEKPKRKYFVPSPMRWVMESAFGTGYAAHLFGLLGCIVLLFLIWRLLG